MLLTPFAAAVIVSRTWDWLILPALGALLTFFLVREPVLILARQALRWRDQRLESAAARRWLLWEAPLLAFCGLLLGWQLPLLPLSLMAAGGMAFTAFAVWMALRNRQRSLPFQIFSAALLSTSSLLGALSTTRLLPVWAWWLWLFFFLHAATAVLVVRARLERMGQAKALGALYRAAVAAQIVLLAGAAALGSRLAAPLLFSAAVHLGELWFLRNPNAERQPLRRVGWRALSASLLHACLAIWALY